MLNPKCIVNESGTLKKNKKKSEHVLGDNLFSDMFFLHIPLSIKVQKYLSVAENEKVDINKTCFSSLRV